MGKLPANYISPKQRVTMLKGDYPKDGSSIRTSAMMQQVGDALVVLVKASIYIGDKVVGEGHAFTDVPEEDKAVEKAETTAIGRALVNAGYPELDTGGLLDDEEEDEDEKPAKKASKGLGSKPSAAKAKSKKEEPEEEDDESDDDDEEDEKPAKKATGLGAKIGGKAKPAAKSASDDSGDADDEGEESEDDEEESSEEEKPAASKKLTREELLAKYKKPGKK